MRGVQALRMNNFQFIHLCKDAGFAEPEGRLHREALDVIFFRAAQVGQRQISYKASLDIDAWCSAYTRWCCLLSLQRHCMVPRKEYLVHTLHAKEL